MAHIVDAIMVTLGLDAAAFNRAAKEAEKTQNELIKSFEGSEDAAKEFKEELADLKKEIEEANKRKAEAARKLKSFILATIDAAKNVYLFALECAGLNDELIRLESSLGISTQKINGMRGAGAALGGTAEGMTNSMKSLNKGMNDFVVKGDTTLLPFMNHLGVAMVDGQGKLRDVDKVMLDLADSFSEMNSEQAYALGQDMGFDEGTIAALMQGRDAMKEMSEYHAKMYTSSKEELAASRELSKNQAQLSAHWASMKLMIGNAIIPLLVKLTNFAKAFFEFLQDHQKTVKNVFEAMAFVLGAVLIPLFGKALIAALAFIAPFAPFILVVTAIAAAFTLLYDDYKVWAEGGQSLFDWGKFSDLIDGAKLSVDSLTKGFGELADKVMAEVIPTLKGYASIIQKLFSGDFAGASAEAKEMFAEFGSRAKDAISPAWNKAADFMLGGAFKIGENQSPAVSGGFAPSGSPSKGFTPQKAATIARVAKNIGVNPNDLAAVISFETGGTFSPSAKNPKSSATGLIQFMSGSGGTKGKYYGMSRDDFANLSFDEQMKYVEKYYKDRHKNFRSGNESRNTVGDVYGAVTGYGYKEGTAAYDLNRVWDSNENGVIEKGEMVQNPKFRAHQKQYFPSALQQGAAQAQGMVQQSATPRKLYNSKGLQSDMQSRSVDVKMGDLNIYTTASSVSGITSDAMRGVEASLNNLGTSMA